MATRYVENYRIDDMNDTQTIQAAINALKDGDTLVFNKTYDRHPITDEDIPSTTYVLDEPVDFTRCNLGDDETPVIVNKTRRCLTINGNGCTICGSDSFISNYGKDSQKALFFISDNAQHGLKHSVIKNFIFKWKGGETGINESEYPMDTRNIAIGVISTDHSIESDEERSVYFSFGTIENCEFNGFGTGIYICGENSDIRQCYFENCYIGINSDGTEHLNVYNNYFYTTQHYGLLLNNSFRSNAYGNVFYKCSNISIAVGGPQNGIGVRQYLTVNIYGNKIFGSGKADENNIWSGNDNQVGIRCNGIKDVVIRDNFIQDICYISDTQSEKYDNYGQYGIGIFLIGNNNADNKRISERVIIADNIIKNSERYGIGVDLSSSCTISGNSIHSGELGNSNDYGIYIGNYAGDLDITNNKLYHFEDEKFIRPSAYNVNMSNNIYYKKAGVFNPLFPERYIQSYLSDESTMTICIPELSVPLENGEEFELFVPQGYSSSTVTTIIYNGHPGILYNSSGIPYNIPSSEIGDFIRVKYVCGQSANSGQMYISFTAI